MPEVLTGFRRVQIGPESVLGTAVACTKQLSASNIIPTETIETATYVPLGQQYATKQTVNKDYTPLALTGIMSFREVIYQLMMLYGSVSPTTPGGGTLSRQWQWKPSPTSPATEKSATLQYGDGVRAQQTPGCVASGIEFKMTRDGTCEVTEPLTGWNEADGATFTSTPTIIGEAPIIPEYIDVYYDTVFGSLGSTQLTRVFEVTFGVTDAKGVFWAFNRAVPSWVGTAQGIPKPTIKIKVEADSTGMGLLADIRSGALKWLRIEAIGPIIEAAIPYSFVIDASVFAITPGAPADFNGLQAREFDLYIGNDGTNAPLSITAVNDLTAF